MNTDADTQMVMHRTSGRDWFTTKEFAILFGYSVDHVYWLIRVGWVRAYRPAARGMFHISAKEVQRIQQGKRIDQVDE